jgi:RNA polymerase sigma-70 factor (ECF subfamily)
VSDTSDALALTFLSGRGTPSLPPPALGEKLEAALDEAHAKWPGVEVAADAFARHVASRVPDGAELESTLAALNLADLYLACGCVEGVAAAVDTFNARLMSQIGAFVARVASGRDFVDEVAQRLRVKLLVGANGEAPRIGQYGGRGSLESWVCAAAIRVALDLHRGPAAGASADVDELPLPGPGDPELDYLRHEYADHFRTATADAFGVLSARERTLLRLYYLERLTLDKIAPIYRVHATTVMRWLGEARESILGESRRLLRERLSLSESEVAALLPMMRSGLDLSVRRLVESQR